MAPRSSTWMAVILLSTCISLAGCASMSSLTGPSQDFVTAANALAQAESDYFDEIQAASDAAYRLQAAETYVMHEKKFVDVAKELSKHDDFSKAKKLRVTAMSQLQNYAQKIAAITTGASPTWIASDATTATTNIQTLVKDAGYKSEATFLTSNAGVIEKAVTVLGNAIIGAESAKELRSLAREAQGPIEQIAVMVKEDKDIIEGSKYAQGLTKDQSQALCDILKIIYDDPKVNPFERFNALQLTANWKPSLVTKGQAIESALKKLQAANDAMAKKEDTSISGLAKQAYSFAKQALDTPAPKASAPIASAPTASTPTTSAPKTK